MKQVSQHRPLIPYTDPPQSNQEALDRAVAFFSRPGAVRAAYTDEHGGEMCAYRTADGGAACGIGCLIPDAIYTPSLEGRAWFDYTDDSVSADVAAIVGTSSIRPILDYLAHVADGFLDAVQSAHDDAIDVPTFLTRLREVAAEYELQWPGEAS